MKIWSLIDLRGRNIIIETIKFYLESFQVHCRNILSKGRCHRWWAPFSLYTSQWATKTSTNLCFYSSTYKRRAGSSRSSSSRCTFLVALLSAPSRMRSFPKPVKEHGQQHKLYFMWFYAMVWLICSVQFPFYLVMKNNS